MSATPRFRLISPLVGPWPAALAGFVLTIALFFPGGMSTDSISQLAQARSGQFSNWHPPVMAAAWRLVDGWLPGPFGMFALQAAAWWAGLALVARSWLSGRHAAIAVLAVGLWPPFFGMVGTVWKDVHMAAAFTLAAGLMLARPGDRPRPEALALALLAVAYGTAMRHNGALAAAPLAIYAGWHLAGWALGHRAWRAVATAALVLLTLSAPIAANRALTGYDAHVEQLLYAFDLAGIEARTGVPVVPSVMHAGPVTAELIRRTYDPNYVDPLYPHVLAFRDDARSLDTMREAWREAIWRHPGAYAAHRAEVVLRLWGLAPQVWFAYHRGVLPNDLGVPEGASWHNAPLFALYWVLKFTPLYRPFFYLVALGAGLVLAV
ncbi:MAG: hypothetical protein ACK46X_21815, partial [Candidatus Sericytochromatia bacterium]